MNKILKAAAAVALLAGLVAAPSAATAVNADSARAAATVVPSDNTVTSAKIVDRSIGAGDYGLKSMYGTALRDNTVPWLALGSQLRGEIRASQTKADNAALKATAAEDKADDALARPDKGTEAFSKDFAQTTVDKIGGPFASNATLIGTITLPKGTLKVDVDGFWTTLAAGPAGTRPQLALRGTDVAVTIFPGEASPTANRELTGHATKKVVLAVDTEVKVYAFGYNDDTSGNGAGRLAVTTSIVATYL